MKTVSSISIKQLAYKLVYLIVPFINGMENVLVKAALMALGGLRCADEATKSSVTAQIQGSLWPFAGLNQLDQDRYSPGTIQLQD